MKNFEYAQPRSEREAIALLAEAGRQSVVLAGGTDLMGLMERMVVAPDRVVNISEIASLQEIVRDELGNVWIGAAVRLDDWMANRHAESYPSLLQVIEGISSVQLRGQGTCVGELMRRPTCWYFRQGHGLLADQGRLVVYGDNRYHAILGNRGPAKFVNASRLAPSMIALGAMVRVVGPREDAERVIPLAELYQTPGQAAESENRLLPGQFVTHVMLPEPSGCLSAAYEVRHGEGPDQPLAAAAVSVRLDGGRVHEARIVLGQVAPTPWIAVEAARSLKGGPLNESTAAIAGWEAVSGASPLSGNEYKVQLAQVAVKRALLRAAGLPTGGLEVPFCRESEHAFA